VKLSFTIATEADATTIVALQNAAAEHLTRQFGQGVWSGLATEKSVLKDLRRPKFSKTLIALDGTRAVATLRLATKKPWAIDTTYFTAVPRALYLVGMAVHPDAQGKGMGRQILKAAEAVARNWPGNAIRLDAFDAVAGAGPFYAKCGYREVGRVVYRSSPLVYFELVLA
jgi:predicted N-acetyltransferase YhbS